MSATLFRLAGPMEAEVQRDIRLALGRLPHVRLFRNQVGEGWMGDVVHKDSTHVTLAHPRRVPFGLFPGSADLVGWTSVIVTPEMVGQTVAIFTSPEVKRPKARKPPEEQFTWRDNVLRAGGRAGFAYSVADALALVAV